MKEKTNKKELVQDHQEQSEEINNKTSSDERLNNKDLMKERSQNLPIKQSYSKQKKPKSRLLREKRKRIGMYSVLTIFCLLLLSGLLFTHYYFEENITNLLDKNKKFYLLLFICLLTGSLILSSFVCFCECFLKAHLFGVLFFIILNLAINYCIIYSIILVNYFEQLFCAIIILSSGSLGLLIITLVAKDDVPSLFILIVFNGLFSFVAGCIMCLIFNKFWNIFFSFLSFFISEFNVYSSQYQFGNKKKKEETLIYSQPFELIISIFKLFYFIIYLLIKFIKILLKMFDCKKKKKKEDKNQKRKDNREKEGEVEEREGNEGEVELEENKGKVKIIDQSQG